jgi:hypothetical protein
MKKLAVIFLMSFLFVSCSKDKDSPYTRNELQYNLYQSSDFNYTGTLSVKELVGGELELTIELIGNKGNTEYFFPAHLHFGTYDDPNAPIAYLLNPIDIKSLRSVTILGQLSSGTKLNFNEFRNFDGHVKIHLADSGPEYQVILTAGNIGINDNRPEAFIKENMTLCSPYY